MHKGGQQLVYVGVQPFAVAKQKDGTNQLFLLLGREREVASTGEERGSWSDFGGGPDADELNDPLRGAIRECYEESMGLIGNKEEIREAIIATHQRYPSILGDEYPHTDSDAKDTGGISFARRVMSDRRNGRGEGIPCIFMNDKEKKTYAVVFLMQIPYDENMPNRFRNVFQYGHPCFKKKNSGHCEGSWEKDDAVWIPLTCSRNTQRKTSSCKDNIEKVRGMLYSNIGAGGMRKEYEESFCHFCSILASKIPELKVM